MYAVFLVALLFIGDNMHEFDVAEWKAETWEDALIVVDECNHVAQKAENILYCEIVEVNNK